MKGFAKGWFPDTSAWPLGQYKMTFGKFYSFYCTGLKTCLGQVWCCMPLIWVLGGRAVDLCEFEASVVYIVSFSVAKTTQFPTCFQPCFQHVYMYMCVYIYIYIRVCVCICVCMCMYIYTNNLVFKCHFNKQLIVFLWGGVGGQTGDDRVLPQVSWQHQT